MTDEESVVLSAVELSLIAGWWGIEKGLAFQELNV